MNASMNLLPARFHRPAVSRRQRLMSAGGRMNRCSRSWCEANTDPQAWQEIGEFSRVNVAKGMPRIPCVSIVID